MRLRTILTTTTILLSGGAIAIGGAAVGSGFTASSRIENALKEAIPNPEYRNTFDDDDLPEVYKAFGRQYKPEILAAAEKRDVPAEYIMAAILGENVGRRQADDVLDNLALACGWLLPNKYGIEYGGEYIDSCFDPSLGIGQIRRSVAKKLAEKYDQGAKDIAPLTTELQVTRQNIEYIGMVLADLTHSPNEQPSHGNYFDPHYVSIIGTRYVKGPTDTPLTVARPSCEGMHFVKYLGNFPSRSAFGETVDRITQAQQQELRAYAERQLPLVCEEKTTTRAVDTFLAKI